MRNKKFFDTQQANQYLRHCVIRVAGEPIYIQEVGAPERKKDGYTLTYNKVRSMGGIPKTIASNDEDVDMNPVPLGMVQYYNGDGYTTFFASRYPARRWKVGLSNENYTLTYLLGLNAGAEYKRAFFPTNILADVIEGKYLAPDDCQSKVNKTGGSLPFSRRFALDSAQRLYYKDAPEYVGFAKKSSFELLPEFMYLKEALEEDVNAHH